MAKERVTIEVDTLELVNQLDLNELFDQLETEHKQECFMYRAFESLTIKKQKEVAFFFIARMIQEHKICEYEVQKVLDHPELYTLPF